MLTKLKLALLISAPLAGAATYAAAQGDGHKKAEMIQKFDANKDGALDDAERAQLKAAFKARRAERHAKVLAQFDANKDGSLDAAERGAMRDARATERFKKLDANGDGAVTLDEFKAAAPMKGHHGRAGHWRSRGTGAKL